MKLVVQIVLAAVVVLLGYLLVDSIMKPIRFERAKDVRYQATIERLKEIRTAQEAYRSVYHRYTGNFDTLLNLSLIHI